uniref:Kringle domain-containing protein n=1 Tax=Elaeophora elaphi TaxID=1147741 RepID=A0A0R3RGE8_9BILA
MKMWMSSSDVECIPTAYLKNYLYYGNVSTYIPMMISTATSVKENVSSMLGRCEVWKSVVSAMIQWALNNSIKDYWIYPDEFMNHSNCRNFDLTQQNDDKNHHLAVHMKIIKSNASSIGPWCYTYDHAHSKYYVARCFPECVGSNYRNTTAPPRHTKILTTADAKPNYNTKLIDSIAVNTFSKYEWGPSAYYDSRPSNLLLSAEFERNRYSIFFAMIAIGMIIMVCSISFVIARNCIEMRGKEMKEGEIKGNISEEIQATAKNVATAIVPPISNRFEKLKEEMGTPV